MKILTRKRQDDILKLLTANLTISINTSMDVESFHYTVDNIYEIATIVDGLNGLNKVHNTCSRYVSKKISELDKD